MKGIISKASAFLMTIILIISLLPDISAMAVYVGEERGSITIRNVTAGNILRGYKVIDITYDSAGDKVHYAWAEGIADVIKETNGGEEVSIEEFNEMKEQDRQKLLTGIPKIISGTPDLKESTADSSETVKWTDAELGGYLIIPTNSTDVYQIMLAVLQPVRGTENTDFVTEDVEIEAKKSPALITKNISSDTTGITKTVDYTLVSDVPDYAEGAIDKYYGISDKADEELEIIKSSIRVYGYDSRTSAEDIESEGTEFGTLIPNEEFEGLYKECEKLDSQTEKQDFALEFDYDKLPENVKAIKITYTSRIRSNVTVDAEGLNNVADMEYSCYPFTTDGEFRRHEVKSAVQIVKTYRLEIIKVDSANNTKKLSGAEFDLYRKAAENENEPVVPSKDVPKQLESGDYVFVGHIGPTNGNGIASIENLDLGKYYLVETKAPSGYTLPGNALEITVSKDDGLNEATGVQTVTVENAESFNLPQTGDNGTIIFTIIGIVLMLGAVVMFFVMRRKENSKESSK